MNVDYIQSWGDDLIVANAARVSFDKYSTWEFYDEDGRGPIDCPSPCGEYFNIAKLKTADEKLIHYLAKHKHTSCFEHMGATLKLKVPIFIARQIQRHRTFSYNEISRRYVDSPPEFFWPDKWRARADNAKQGSGGIHPNSEQWDNRTAGHMHSVVALYDNMLVDGVAPELARMILPQNMYTEFYMSGNLRAWSHFLHLRLDGHAQAEVRVVAEQVKDILTPLFPVSIKALLRDS